MSKCQLCPRNCSVDRHLYKGFCGCSDKIKVARATLHFWEEPCISGTGGSGTVFFSGCHLKCVFCQNYDISHKTFGKEITEQQLADIFDRLCDQGAHNINLVSPSHYTDQIIKALKLRKSSIPVVWNSSGYEKVQTLEKLKGMVDIYLVDMKYSDDALARKYSNADNYFSTAQTAVKEMFKQVGQVQLDRDGIMQKGVIIRHLLLPDAYENTRGVADWVSENFKNDEVIFSLMGQYTPAGESCNFVEINRRVTDDEYRWAKNYCHTAGIENGYFQELSSADEAFIPSFDLQGV